MRYTAIIFDDAARKACLLMLTLALAALLTLAPAQAASVQSATPSDPLQRLEAGRQHNGLAAPGAKPWHVKATYHFVGNKQKPGESGTFEEWWFSEKQYKIAYHSATFNQEEFNSDKGLFRSGDQNWPPWPLSLIRRAIEHPVPPPDEILDAETRDLKRSFGAVTLPCTAVTKNKRAGNDSASYCFEPSMPILRYSNEAGRIRAFVYDQFSAFDGHYVAHDVKVQIVGAFVLAWHLDGLDLLDPGETSACEPPPDAQAATRRLSYFPRSNIPVPKHFADIEFPDEARARWEGGEILVIVRVGTDGRAIDAFAVAGDGLFQQASVAGTRKMTFNPLLVDGQPVEFEVQVEENFSIH